jgi:hypothetical protein
MVMQVVSPRPQTDEPIATGRRVGREIATELVAESRARGLPAERASAGTIPRIRDLVLRGYVLSFAEGSSTVEGRAKATAQEIAKVLKQRFQAQGWIP